MGNPNEAASSVMVRDAPATPFKNSANFSGDMNNKIRSYEWIPRSPDRAESQSTQDDHLHSEMINTAMARELTHENSSIEMR